MASTTIKINAIEYTVTSDKSEEFIHKAASYLDKQLGDIIKRSGLPLNSAVILAALNITGDYLELHQSSDHIRNEISFYVNEVERYKKEQEQLSNQISTLKKQIEDLK